MKIPKIAYEMFDKMKTNVQNSLDQEIAYERWANIEYAAQAMLESKVEEQQILNMLIKYWDLRPREANDVLRSAQKCISEK